MDVANDPAPTVWGEESFIVNGVLPPQCSFHEEFSYKISSARMRQFFCAFEIYRVFRKSMLNLDDASDEEARQQLRNRLVGRQEQLYADWCEEMKDVRIPVLRQTKFTNRGGNSPRNPTRSRIDSGGLIHRLHRSPSTKAGVIA